MAKKKSKPKKEKANKLLLPECRQSVYCSASVWATACPNCGFFVASGEIEAHTEQCKALPKALIKKLQQASGVLETHRLLWQHYLKEQTKLKVEMEDETLENWREFCDDE
jgi:hypothetical protein